MEEQIKVYRDLGDSLIELLKIRYIEVALKKYDAWYKGINIKVGEWVLYKGIKSQIISVDAYLRMNSISSFDTLLSILGDEDINSLASGYGKIIIAYEMDGEVNIHCVDVDMLYSE